MLRAVVRVDAHILNGEVAGPYTRVAVSGMQINYYWDTLRQHFSMSNTLVESVFASSMAHANTRELDINAVRIEWNPSAPRGREEAAPIGVGARECCLYQG